VREVTNRFGILMIADEIQMGLGRCGHWLLSRAQGWQADLTVLGKSLGGGIAPISAVVGRESLLNRLPAGTESETFAASPLAVSVAIEVMEQLRDGPWISRAVGLGQRLQAACQEGFANTESLGASAAIEFIQRGVEPTRAAWAARQFATRCLQAGLLVHYSGPLNTRIIFLPALTISDVEFSEVTAVIRQLVSENHG
jgi:4-aminobutyrate aminotransferase-like enzyme